LIQSHPSIKVIEENKTEIKDLCFNAVDSDFVAKQIDKINIKKATGKDGISSKILKLSESEVKHRSFISVLFSSITFILGWLSFIIIS
jgi:hypothetical protein